MGFFKKKKGKNGTAGLELNPDGQSSLREIPYVFFDTELTGLDEKESLLSIGAVYKHGQRPY